MSTDTPQLGSHLATASLETNNVRESRRFGANRLEMRKRIFIESLSEIQGFFRFPERLIVKAQIMRRHQFVVFTLAAVSALVVLGSYYNSNNSERPTGDSKAPANSHVGEFQLISLQEVAHFAELNFGLPFDAFADLKPVTEQIIPPRRTHAIESTVRWFQRANDLSHIDGVSVRKIYYGFVDGEFAEVVVMPSGRSEFGRNLLDSLEREYAGERIDHETWFWVGKRTAIAYHGFCSLETSAISVVYIFPRDKALRRLHTDADWLAQSL